MSHPETVLQDEEIVAQRTPQQLICWVAEKRAQFEEAPESREWLRANRNKPLPKKFFEEVYPLSLFAQHRYAERTDVVFQPNLNSNESLDARIWDISNSTPSVLLNVEVTYAKDGYNEALRIEYLSKHGSVKLFSKLTSTGTKNTGHEISLDENWVRGAALVRSKLELLLEAIRGKSRKQKDPRKYGDNTILLVVFDDIHWCDTARLEYIKHQLSKFISACDLDPDFCLDFTDLYLVGISGDVCEAIALKHSLDPI